ncbi:intermediate cleavage peptidase Icp55 [Schizosaccharomyces japonicus yFS275]|uniref:Intermediate cleavage peptidase Icp55 n=1 Tax=Schizosaccharomyces japonicus (strain yFS275 / FY16936) TaxID=402676 RepID=B6JZ71_SCHJY|nr:intermediate cleavage peptidase Icp55 [Schizosaccharomyces japonicus yFS275]EEB06839.2 intermediate cleavage peptidase Icp55 [Schizosaccharomyces japonicus yFS275]
MFLKRVFFRASKRLEKPGQCVYRNCIASFRQYATFGQPTHETHPHLIASNELTRGISKDEYKARQLRATKALDKNEFIVTTSAPVNYMCGPAFYEYHQDPNFFYLTGCLEPSSAAIIEPDSSKANNFRYTLFLRPKDAFAEKWEGTRTGLAAAENMFGADEVLNIHDFQKVLQNKAKKYRCAYADVPMTGSTTFGDLCRIRPPTIAEAIVNLSQSCSLKPISRILHPLRCVKLPGEIHCMKHAGQISGEAYANVFHGGQIATETQLAATLDYEFRVGNCERSAYVPVVAGGLNGLTIHYTVNNNVLKDGDMVLVDAGGEYGNYVTDISRTWPVNGRFTESQRDIYQAVLNVQKECIKLCTENQRLSIAAIHNHSSSLLREELRQIGIYASNFEIENVLYPHSVGHHIGLEIHDCSSISTYEPIKKNQVITIEPGVYFPMDDRWPRWAQGVAIRIEDSILVGKDEPINLSEAAPKEITDIEMQFGKGNHRDRKRKK